MSDHYAATDAQASRLDRREAANGQSDGQSCNAWTRNTTPLLLKEGWHPLSESEADDGVVNQPRG